MDLIINLGITIFAASTVYFYLTQKKVFNTAFLVSITTLASYVLMRSGTIVWDNGGMETDIYYTRWAFYILSCSLLVYEIAKLLGKSGEEKSHMIYLIVFTMITGILAAISSDLYKWAFFAISTLAYGELLFQIFNSKSENLKAITPYVLFGWSVFPIVFLFSPEGLNVINNTIAFAIYLVLDVFTKIIFYFTKPQD